MSDALYDNWMESNARDEMMSVIAMIARRIYRYHHMFENKEDRYDTACRDVASLIKTEIERLEHG